MAIYATTRSMRRTRTRIAGVIAVALALVAGCSSSKNNNSSNAPSSSGSSTTSTNPFAAQAAHDLVEPAAIPSFPAVSGSVPKGKKIYFVNAGTSSHQLIGAGMSPLVDALGWSLHSVTFVPTNPSSANSAILSAISSGADGIVVVGAPAAAIQTSLATAKQKNIPVVAIAFTDPTSTPNLYQVSNIAVSADAWAKMVVTAILADAAQKNQTAHIAILSTNASPVFQALANADVSSVKSQCSACSVDVIAMPLGDMLAGKGGGPTVSFVQSHPKTNYVIAIGYPGTMRSALNAAGHSDIAIGGQASTLADNQGVKSGDYLFWLDTPQGYSGGLALDSLVRAFTGGDPTVHNNESMPAWVINKDSNIPTDTLPEFPLNYTASFEKLWNLS